MKAYAPRSLISSSEGVGSSDGWVWQRMKERQASRTAGRKISRGWRSALSRMPMEISSSRMRRLCESSRKTCVSSFSRDWMASRIYSAMKSGLLNGAAGRWPNSSLADCRQTNEAVHSQVQARFSHGFPCEAERREVRCPSENPGLGSGIVPAAGCLLPRMSAYCWYVVAWVVSWPGLNGLADGR